MSAARRAASGAAYRAGGGGPAPGFMIISNADLAALPTSGTPYLNMKAAADNAIATVGLNVSSPSATSPWLSNDDVLASSILGAALVYARTGNATYGDFVLACCRYVIGSEDQASTDGTPSADRALAVMRHTPAFVLAADLIGLPRTTTMGSRTGFTSTSWQTWLTALPSKTIVASGNPTILSNAPRSHNWGAWASATLIAIYAYLGDATGLATAVTRLKDYLGETMGAVSWTPSGSFDVSWACTTGLPGGVTAIPVNHDACGPLKDGVIVDDAGRNAASYTGATNGADWDDDGIDYSFHALGAQLNAAIILDRLGHSVWGWGNQAFKRMMDRMVRLATEKGVPTIASGNGRSSQYFIPWIIEHFYGGTYTKLAPDDQAHSINWTNWLYP